MGQDIVVGVAAAVLMIFPMAVLLRERLMQVTTVHMHRGVTHGALKLRYLLRLWCDYTLNRMLVWMQYWVFIHLKHHAKTDTEEDPHPPVLLLDSSIDNEVERWRDAVERHRKTNLAEYRAGATRAEVLAAKRPADLTFIDNWGKHFGYFSEGWRRRVGYITFVWLWLTHMIPYAVVGLLLGVNMWIYMPMAGIAAIVSLAWAGQMYIQGSSDVNSYGHGWPVRSENKAVGHASNHNRTARRTGGEGRQYDHHLRQRSARIRVLRGTKRRDDVGWEIIRVLRALHLTVYVHEDPDEPNPPEERELDDDGYPIGLELVEAA